MLARRSLCSTLQWLKLIKFINGFVPKMSLATSVLSHGLSDLAMFTLFFCFTIYAFAQMFYIQLGPYLDDYNGGHHQPTSYLLTPSHYTNTCLVITSLRIALYSDMTSSFFSLFRSLFGDFDIDTIMDNSSNYINAVLLIVYLFSGQN